MAIEQLIPGAEFNRKHGLEKGFAVNESDGLRLPIEFLRSAVSTGLQQPLSESSHAVGLHSVELVKPPEPAADTLDTLAQVSGNLAGILMDMAFLKGGFRFAKLLRKFAVPKTAEMLSGLTSQIPKVAQPYIGLSAAGGAYGAFLEPADDTRARLEHAASGAATFLGLHAGLSGVNKFLPLARLRNRVTELEKLAYGDELTGLGSRTALALHMTREVGYSQRTKSPLTLLYGDLNDFKQVNDRFGHTAGDNVLRLVAEKFKASMRPYDLAFRLGGDEFVAVLRADYNTADTVAKRIADNSRIVVIRRGRTVTIASLPEADKVMNASVRADVSLSVGIAQYQAGETVAQFLARADNLMYERKATIKRLASPLAVHT